MLAIRCYALPHGLIRQANSTLIITYKKPEPFNEVERRLKNMRDSLKSEDGGSSSGKSPAQRGASGDASSSSRRDPGGGSEGEGAGGGGDGGGLEAKVGRMQEQIDSLTAELAELRAMVQTLMPKKKPPAEGIPKR